MADDQDDRTPSPEPYDESLDEEEEIPRSVMIVLVTLAIGLAVAYLVFAGGHNHFH